MARPRRNTAAAAAKVDTAETVQAVKEESAVCAAGEKGAVSAAGQKKTACVAEEKNDAGVAEENTTHEAGRTVVVEFAGKQIMAKDVLQKAEEAYLAAHKDVEIKTLELYISPEQNAAYYVVNGEASEDFVVQL
ncbi:DUF6465 family protein [Lachnoclostridium pacaense]|uniref:DUF6465 family protein n=1 Tax=Enterocloster hominis (ex Hitch et al. 2024) TaxID=1917870 RepID=UPI001D0FBC72|nr:DUF6465 family protein [Lachnoclostridium pacaense]MCC2819220.1 DUF6465 family protein [Lachnoclostridium pacaense]